MSHLAVSPLCQWPAAAAECLTRCTQQIPTANTIYSMLLGDETESNTGEKKKCHTLL